VSRRRVHEVTGICIHTARVQPEFAFRDERQRRVLVDSQRLDTIDSDAEPLPCAGSKHLAGVNGLPDRSPPAVTDDLCDGTDHNPVRRRRRRLHKQRHGNHDRRRERRRQCPAKIAPLRRVFFPCPADELIHTRPIGLLRRGLPLAMDAVIHARFDVFGYGRARTGETQQSLDRLVVAILWMILIRLVVHLAFSRIALLSHRARRSVDDETWLEIPK
jgi:hypothetical protein